MYAMSLSVGSAGFGHLLFASCAQSSPLLISSMTNSIDPLQSMTWALPVHRSVRHPVLVLTKQTSPSTSLTTVTVMVPMIRMMLLTPSPHVPSPFAAASADTLMTTTSSLVLFPAAAATTLETKTTKKTTTTTTKKKKKTKKKLQTASRGGLYCSYGACQAIERAPSLQRTRTCRVNPVPADTDPATRTCGRLYQSVCS